MKHILLAEDEESIRRYLTVLLGRQGYDVSAVRDGKEALDYIKSSTQDPEKHIDLLITDIRMPNLSGFELIDEMNKENIAIPAVVITGSEDRKTVLDALRKGFQEFIDKPIVEKQLIESLQKTFKKIELEDTRTKKLLKAAETQKISFDKIIGKYRLLKIIGEGANGTVYLCERTDNGIKCAFKTLRLNPTGDKSSEMSIRRFIHESNAISQLKHPNIVNFVEFGYVGSDPATGIPYIVMEYFEGVSMKHYINEPDKIDLKSKIHIIHQIADALSSVHAKNIFHRDIKPDNVLVDKQLTVKITDFGVCHLPTSDLTMTTELMGSPGYMAPEYLQYGKVGKLLDIYALGVVSYELLTGCKPFDANNLTELMEKVIHHKPDDPRKIFPDFPPYLLDVLGMMLRKNPRRRYQDASEIKKDLENYVPGKSANSFIDGMRRTISRKFDWN
ncbi:MAG: hypothetical protein A2017_17320 [Lentisphaerae bacterium GWF2_44_16]|nr:MAG: hypothetical protein A2017_17320 [Lentisphaerae bacterium GWF2_44_16]